MVHRTQSFAVAKRSKVMLRSAQVTSAQVTSGELGIQNFLAPPCFPLHTSDFTLHTAFIVGIASNPNIPLSLYLGDNTLCPTYRRVYPPEQVLLSSQQPVQVPL